MKTRNKKLDYLKDKVIDLLNDADEIGIRDIETNDKKGIFTVLLQDGNIFEVECRKVEDYGRNYG